MPYATNKKILSEGFIEPSSSDPMVAIVVLNWNGWNDTINCLDSLINHDFQKLHIVVVDNNSRDGSLSHIAQYIKDLVVNWEMINLDSTENVFIDCKISGNADLGTRRLTLLSMDNNYGFSGGCNRGVEFLLRERVPADNVLFLNNDCILFSGCIRYLVKSACKNDGVAAALQYTDQGIFPSIYMARWPLLSFVASPVFGKPIVDVEENLDVKVDWVSGAVLLISTRLCRQMIAEGGYVWRESYFLYSEDFELSYRLRTSHIQLVVSTLAKVEHRVGSSASGLLAIYYMRRNRSLICRDHCRAVFKVPCLALVAGIGLARAARQWFLGNHDVARVHLLATKDGLLGRRGKWLLHDEYTRKWNKS